MPRGKWAYGDKEEMKLLRSIAARKSARERQCPACKRKAALQEIWYGRRCRYCGHEFGTSEKYTGPGTKPSERRAARQQQEEQNGEAGH